MSIRTVVDKDNDLTVFKAEGTLTFDELLETVKGFYEGAPTANVIWDAAELEDVSVSSADLTKIVLYTKENGGKRASGRTALVLNAERNYGLGRMFSIFAQSEDRPWPVQTFETMDEAMSWIAEGSS